MNINYSNKFILGDFKKVVTKITKKINGQKTTIVLPCSLHDLAQIQKQAQKKSKNNSFYNKVDIFTTDSMWLTQWFRFQNNLSVDRVYGPDLMTTILEKIKKQNLSAVFLGANNKTLHDLKEKTLNNNKSQHYLLIKKSDSSKKEQEIISKVINIQPDILWIGIGSPKQVEIAAKLKSKLKKTTIFCVGAAFDFITNNKKQAPKFVQQTGFEWLFRLVTEPKRLWKRYLIVIPKFMFSTIIKKLFKVVPPNRQKK